MSKKRLDKEHILDQIRIVVMMYGRKSMAEELGKPYSTFSNELNHVEWAKLGFITGLQILEKSQAEEADEQTQQAGFKVLDLIEQGFDRIAYRIPRPSSPRSMPREMRLISKLTKEFGENMAQLADALEDSKWRQDELERCLKENQDLLQACLEMDAYLKALRKRAEEEAGS